MTALVFLAFAGLNLCGWLWAMLDIRDTRIRYNRLAHRTRQQAGTINQIIGYLHDMPTTTHQTMATTTWPRIDDPDRTVRQPPSEHDIVAVIRRRGRPMTRTELADTLGRPAPDLCGDLRDLMHAKIIDLGHGSHDLEVAYQLVQP
jgi:hypothetical protein